jgi:hypothetical protein
MQCILYKIYFWKVFHMYYKLICILYALLCGQNFILVKSGCYSGRGQVPRGGAPPAPPQPPDNLEQLLATQNDLMRRLVANDECRAAEHQ